METSSYSSSFGQDVSPLLPDLSYGPLSWIVNGIQNLLFRTARKGLSYAQETDMDAKKRLGFLAAAVYALGSLAAQQPSPPSSRQPRTQGMPVALEAANSPAPMARRAKLLEMAAAQGRALIIVPSQ